MPPRRDAVCRSWSPLTLRVPTSTCAESVDPVPRAAYQSLSKLLLQFLHSEYFSCVARKAALSVAEGCDCRISSDGGTPVTTSTTLVFSSSGVIHRTWNVTGPSSAPVISCLSRNSGHFALASTSSIRSEYFVIVTSWPFLSRAICP